VTRGDWATIRDDYVRTWDDWSAAVRTSQQDLDEIEEFNNQIDRWLNSTLLGLSDYTDIRNLLANEITNLNEKEQLTESRTSLQETIDGNVETARTKQSEILYDASTYQDSCKNNTWYDYIDS